jgi:hypothetical protein
MAGLPPAYWPIIAQQILAELEKGWRSSPTYILMTWRIPKANG